jgi:hypothetical protein
MRREGLIVESQTLYDQIEALAGSKSRRGTEVAAVFYRLIESVKLANVEPAAYLMAATAASLADPDAVPLLPRDTIAT